MGLRDWIRARTADTAADDADAAPLTALVHAIVGKTDGELQHALGEYTSATYPADLAEALRRRETVAAALRKMNIATPEGRREHLDGIRELLRTYPHPLAYEALILGYADQRRWDEARGVAFAARERRWEVEHSPHPEIRAEVARLKGWTVADIDDLRREAIGELVTPGVLNAAAPATVVAAPEVAPALG